MDKRKFNGNKGHSTKAKGLDKRKNPYKAVLADTLTAEDLSKVVKMLYNKALTKYDVKAAQLLMEYYLGKPKETIESTHNLKNFNIKDIVDFK